MPNHNAEDVQLYTTIWLQVRFPDHLQHVLKPGMGVELE